jgi:selT/selW/selH-like putative selenoprotein
MQCREFLESRFPELRGRVAGGHYPPPAHAALAVKAVGLIQWTGIGLMLAGGAFFQSLGVPEPELYVLLKENKMNAMIGFFFMNSIANSMVATGAFEVIVDGKTIFSRLETGRMPDIGDLVRGFESVGISLPEPIGDEQGSLGQ